MNYILLILFSLLYHVQSQSVVQCDLTGETLYTNGGSGGTGDCGSSLQEGATCTPNCGTGFEINYDTAYYIADGSNDLCDTWDESVPKDDCINAASQLGLSYTSTSLEQTGSHAHSGCFLDGTTLYYFDNEHKEDNYQNPSTYMGRKYLCYRSPLAKCGEVIALTTSGQPIDIGAAACQAYATKIGAGYGTNVNNPGPGCVVTANRKEVRYNSGDCQHTSDCDCSTGNTCVDYTPVDFTAAVCKATTCLNVDTTYTNGNAGECSATMSYGSSCSPECDSGYEVTTFKHIKTYGSESPLTAEVCKTFADNHPIYSWYSSTGDNPSSWGDRPHGCGLYLPTNSIFFNQNTGTTTYSTDAWDIIVKDTGTQTKCNGGTNVNYAQCIDINECSETSGTIDYLTHQFTDGVCGLNGGCVNKDIVNDGVPFICQCNTGYNGTYCNNNIDDCHGQPCYTGTCTDGVADYTCTCLDGWTGDDCDTGTGCIAPAPSTQCSDKSISVRTTGSPLAPYITDGPDQGNYALSPTECELQSGWSILYDSNFLPPGCVKIGTQVYFNIQSSSSAECSSTYSCLERCHDTLDVHTRDNGDVAIYDGTPGIFSLNKEECLAQLVTDIDAQDWTNHDWNIHTPYGCSLNTRASDGKAFNFIWNGNINSDRECGYTLYPLMNYKFPCIERYQFTLPHGPIANGNSNNCTDINHNEYCRIQCNPGYYIINGIGGNDLCWAGGFTGQSEFGNTYQNSSCAACPTGRYTTQLNSVTQCNTFSYYNYNYYQTDIGMPDMSVSQLECETYAGTNWGAPVSISGELKGCYFIPSTGKYYYNTDSTSIASCSLAARKCIQKHFGIDNYYQTDIGMPDMSVSKQECKEYATSKGMTFWEATGGHQNTNPPGCQIWSDGNIKFNPNNNNLPCTSESKAWQIGCIQKHFGYYQSSSGTPDMSVNADECQAYVEATSGLTWNRVDSWSHYHKGCSVYAASGNAYFNTQDTAHNCGDAGHNCIQIKPGTICGDGYHFIAGDNQTDSQCIQCSAGTYSTGGDACQACPVGQQAQNSNNNNEYSSGGASYCVTCADGSDNQDGGECDRCPVGEYSVNGANCSVCGDGKQAQISNSDHVFATLNDIFTVHTSGTSDNSMNESECSDYAGTGFYSSDSWSHIPYGCVRQQSTGNTYWNSNTNSQVGCAGGAYGACVKKTISGGAPYCIACKDGFDNQDNGICDACPIGQNSTGGEECTSCPKGTQAQMNNNDNVFNTGTGSPYCVTCDIGYDNEDGDACDACAAGLVSVNGGKCGTCPINKQPQALNTGNIYINAGALYCVTCRDGYDNHNGGGCDRCALGEYSRNGANCSVCTDGKQAQTSDSDNVFASFTSSASAGAPYCVTCQDGYDNQDGDACDACPEGEYSVGGANCGVCTDGKQSQTSDSDNVFVNSAATKCVTCADGYDNQDGNACEACPEGEYSVGGASCSVCGDGKQAQTSDINTIFVNSAATKCITCIDGYDNQDGNECETCPIGEYSTNGDNCHICDDGKQAQLYDHDNIFNNGTGSPYCITCIDGYDNQDGNACEACPEGEYSVGGANCSVCTDGKQAQILDTGNVFINSAATKCVTCADGYDNKNGNACEACPIGTYSTGGVDCITCPVGRFTTDTNSTSCDLCPPGRYMQQSSSTREEADCIPCPAGYYSGVSGLNDLANANPCNACPLGTWSPTFDSTDVDNPNHPNPISAESHCRSCPAGTKGVSDALELESECISCDPGDESSEPNPTHCTQCDIGTFSEGREVCRTCPENTFQPEKGQDECLETITSCNPGQEIILGNATHPATCLNCNASYHFSPDGINCRDKKTSCIKGFGIQPSGNAIEDDFCRDVYGYEFNEPEANEINELYWTTMSIYCAKRGKFALLTNGRLICAPCSNKLFLYEYEMSNDYLDIESLPASQRASRHGKCCVNPHHKICVKMMDEYHRNCKAELKGTTQVQLQPCDIDPTGDGCPPYIDGPTVLDLYVDEKSEQMITFYNCFDGLGSSSYNWIDIHGDVSFGNIGTYHIHLSCPEGKHSGMIDAVPLPVMVNIIDKPTGVHKVVTFDNQQHDACSYDNIEVNWNGNDMNLYEVDEDGYNTCSGGLIGDEIESEMNSVHSQVYIIGPEVGGYRYYVSNNIIYVNGVSTTPCAEYGKKFKIYCPIPLNRGTTGIPLVPVNNTLN